MGPTQKQAHLDKDTKSTGKNLRPRMTPAYQPSLESSALWEKEIEAPGPVQMSSNVNRPHCKRKRCLPEVVTQLNNSLNLPPPFYSNQTQAPAMAPALCDS